MHLGASAAPNAKSAVYDLITSSPICTEYIFVFLGVFVFCICLYFECAGSNIGVWNAKKQCLRSRGKTRIFHSRGKSQKVQEYTGAGPLHFREKGLSKHFDLMLRCFQLIWQNVLIYCVLPLRNLKLKDTKRWWHKMHVILSRGKFENMNLLQG